MDFITLQLSELDQNSLKALDGNDFTEAANAARRLAARLTVVDAHKRGVLYDNFTRLLTTPTRRSIGVTGFKECIATLQNDPSDVIVNELLAHLHRAVHTCLRSETSLDEPLMKQLLDLTRTCEQAFSRQTHRNHPGWTSLGDPSTREQFLSTSIQLGAGTAAQVYAGYNIDGQRVAVKFIAMERPQMIALVRREIDIVRSMRSHPNVIKYHGIYEFSDRCAFVMEYCETTLEAHLKTLPNERLSEVQAKPWMRQLMLGLLHLKDNNVLHRDLKPANVLLQKQSNDAYTIKIADLNLSRFLEEDDMASTRHTGTPWVWSPEQARGDQYGHLSDMYAAGVVCFYMVTGRFPHQDAQTPAMLVKMQREVPMESLMPKDVTAELRAALLEMMNVNQERRLSWQEIVSHSYFRLYDIPVDSGGIDVRQLSKLQVERAERFETMNKVIRVKLAAKEKESQEYELQLHREREQHAKEMNEVMQRERDRHAKELAEARAAASKSDESVALRTRLTDVERELHTLRSRYSALSKQNDQLTLELSLRAQRLLRAQQHQEELLQEERSRSLEIAQREQALMIELSHQLERNQELERRKSQFENECASLQMLLTEVNEECVRLRQQSQQHAQQLHQLQQQQQAPPRPTIPLPQPPNLFE